MGNCCFSLNEDLCYEIRKDTNICVYETNENGEHSHLPSSLFQESEEKILFEVKDNPYEEYSKALLQRLNEIRQNPALFFKTNMNKSKSYTIESKTTPSLLSWSTKKSRKISDFMSIGANSHRSHTTIFNEVKALFKKDFIVAGYYTYGDLNDINKAFTYLFSHADQVEAKALLRNDYSYCVVYSDTQEQESNAIISYLFLFKCV